MKIKWSLPKILAIVTPIVTMVAIAYGCSSNKPGATDLGVTPPNQEVACSNGQIRECHELLSIHNNTKTCLNATQKCVNGAWGECGAAGDIGVATSPYHGTLTNASFGIDDGEGITIQRHRGCRGRRRGRGGCDGGFTPSGDAGGCDPCDPFCNEINEDGGGLGLDAAGTLDALTGFPSVPNGAVGQNMVAHSRSFGCVQNNGIYNHECSHWPHQPGTDNYPRLGASSCQGDTFCGEIVNRSPDECCHDWQGAPISNYDNTVCLPADGGADLPDLTIGNPGTLATIPGGQDYFPICNRGPGTVPAGSEIWVAIGNQNLLPQVTQGKPDSGFPSPGYSPYTANMGCPNLVGDPAQCAPAIVGAGGLGAGQCIVHTCGLDAGIATSNGGTVAMYVNAASPDGGTTVQECDLSMRNVDSDKTKYPNQPGCADNWTIAPNNQQTLQTAALPTSYTFNYTAACEEGYRIQWKTLQYSASIPTTFAGSSVDFVADMATTLPDGGLSGSLGTFTLAHATGAATCSGGTNDPYLCNGSGPTAGSGTGGSCCPKDLYTIFATPIVQSADSMYLTITLNPTTNGRFSPVLNDWTLTYSCVPSE